MVYRVWHLAPNRSIRRAARARGMQTGRPIYKLNYYNADTLRRVTLISCRIKDRASIVGPVRGSSVIKYTRGVSSDDGSDGGYEALH